MQSLISLAVLFMAMGQSEAFLRTTKSSLTGVRHQPTRNVLRQTPRMMLNEVDALISTVTTAATFPPSLLIAEETGYSGLSLYFTLALYVLTLPGLFSLVTRSVKVKAVQKTYDLPGPANPTAKPLRQTAGEVMAYFKAMNYEATTAEEVITFKGMMGRSNSQAAFLTFCTFMGLGSLGLVLSILLPDLGAKAYLLCLLSPYAGIYYWNNAQREETVKVKMETSDDEQITTIVVEGGKEDLERFSKTLNLPERGKVYVKGIFDEPVDEAAAAARVMMSSQSSEPSQP